MEKSLFETVAEIVSGITGADVAALSPDTPLSSVCDLQGVCKIIRAVAAQFPDLSVAEAAAAYPFGTVGDIVEYLDAVTPDPSAVRQTDLLLTADERCVVDQLASAWNAWCGLDRIHPQENEDFLLAINTAQRIVMARPVQRQFNAEGAS